jgi:hypothetical protein
MPRKYAGLKSVIFGWIVGLVKPSPHWFAMTLSKITVVRDGVTVSLII